MRTLAEVLKLSTEHLASRGVSSPRLDAELLLGHALGLDRLGLYLQHDRPLTPGELERTRELLRRRARREPLPWITGSKEFHSLQFRVRPGLLVPRPDTETLVDALLDELRRSGGDSPTYVVDAGCGTGCVGLTLAHELPHLLLYAVDVDPEALRCTRENALALGLKERVALLQGDLLEPVPRDRPVHWVVSNPPYVPSPVLPTLEPEVSLHEPRHALDGGPDGLDVIRRLLRQAAERASRGIALEVGHDQAAETAGLARRAGFARTSVRRDLAGRERVVLAFKD